MCKISLNSQNARNLYDFLGRRIEYNFWSILKFRNKLALGAGIPLPDRQRDCGLNVVSNLDGDESVDVRQYKPKSYYKFTHLMLCGSRNCPRCAHMLAVGDVKEIVRASGDWQAVKGNTCLMLTETIQHNKYEGLDDLYNKMKLVKRHFNTRRDVRKAYGELCCRVQCHALETPYGDNGWHLHYHVMLFCAGLLDGNGKDVISRNAEILENAWDDSCKKYGVSSIRGVSCRLNGAEHVKKYLSKQALEIAYGVGKTKPGRSHLVTPMKMLCSQYEGVSLIDDGLQQQQKKFLEWHEFCRKRKVHHFGWSKGASEIFPFIKGDDGDKLAEVEKESRVVAKILNGVLLTRKFTSYELFQLQRFGMQNGLVELCKVLEDRGFNVIRELRENGDDASSRTQENR